MQPIRLRAAVFLALFAACSVAGCAKWTVVRKGTWAGHAYTIDQRSSAGAFASTNTLEWRIKVGSLPAVPINATTTDWGPPYTTDLYGTDAYSFIDSRDTTYVDTPFTPGTIGVAHTMLYISPRTLNEEQYETFLRFMTEEFPRLSDSLTGTDIREFPHLIGLVYGSREKFVRDFRGNYNGKKRLVRIEPDGRIRFVNDDKWAAENWSGLAPKVAMPGKKLRLCPPGSEGATLSVDDLRGFRDADDRPVEVVFKVVAEAYEGCR